MAECSKINLKVLYDLERKGKRALIDWCVNEGLLSNHYKCPICRKDMHLNGASFWRAKSISSSSNSFRFENLCQSNYNSMLAVPAKNLCPRMEYFRCLKCSSKFETKRGLKVHISMLHRGVFVLP